VDPRPHIMNTINLIAKKLLSSEGFLFKRGAWYALSPDFINVLYFQRSLYSDLYYLELAVGFNPDHLDTFPKDYQFPKYYTLGARARIKDKDELLRASNLTPENEFQIQSLLLEAISLFSSFTTISGFKQDYLANRKTDNIYSFKAFSLYHPFLTQLELVSY
jgi:hypothetical protein